MEAREKRNPDDARYIVKDSEGYYRWTYEVDSSSNRSFLNMYLIIFALIILVPGAILFFMLAGKGADMGSFLLIWLGIFVLVELLVFLVYKGIEKAKGGVTDIPYLMGEDFIVVHPGNEWTPTFYLNTFFSQVKRVKEDRNSDLILLYEVARVTYVYVPRDDYSLVLGYILDRVPGGGSK